MKRLELKIPPLLLMILFGVAFFYISKVDPFNFESFILPSFFIVGVGVVIFLWSGIIFKNEKTTVDPMNPSKCNRLVVKGIYKYSRNPMYLSFYLWLLAWSIYLGSPLSIVFSLFLSCIYIFFRFSLKKKS